MDVTWAINTAGGWPGKNAVDRLSVVRQGTGAHIGVDYTHGVMAMITTSHLFDTWEFDLQHSFVHVRHVHQQYKRYLGAPMGGMRSAFYAIHVCSRRELMAFQPRRTAYRRYLFRPWPWGPLWNKLPICVL